ncbi:hypothetical protein GCM10027020_02770 [Nocardioides salsibiostraticola]
MDSLFCTSRTSRLRAVMLWTFSTASLAVLLRWLVGDLVSSSPPASFDAALVSACMVAIGLCAVWAWLVVGVVVLEIVRRSSGTTPGVPTWARGLVLMTCGVAAVGLASPAGAAEDIDLDGLPMPDRASGGFLAETVRPVLRAARPPAAGGTETTTHRVTAGESLWSIAEGELGDPARWTEIYDLNRGRIGADPDFIEIAQRLDLPHQ